MHPLCKAFCLDTDEELARQWAKIPDDTEILITHSPPYGILDMVDDRYNCGNYHVGSKSLLDRIDQLKNLKLVIFGHIHGGYGQIERNGVIFVNASIQTEYFEPVNKPIRIELKQPKTT